MVKVSIIVAVYNTEQYLRRCMVSLVCQTLGDIEVIIVNDASPDNSRIIMEEYEKKYPTIVKCIYLKENLRQGGARNKGLGIATGEYVTFVDSDDWVDETFCEKLYTKAVETESDLVFCDHYCMWEKTGKRRYDMAVFKEQMGELNPQKLRTLLFQKHQIWEKIIKRSLITDNNIYFPENTFYEDIAVVLLYSLYAKRVAKVSEPLYYYNIRENSTVHTNNNQNQIQNAVMQLMTEVKNRGFYLNYKDELDMVYAYDYYLYPLYKALTSFDEPLGGHMEYLVENIHKYYPKYRENPYYYRYSEPYYSGIATIAEISVKNLIKLYTSGELKENAYHYDEYYLQTRDRAENLLSYCKQNNYKIALWGAGLKGKDFLKSVDPDSKKIHFVIDKNSKLRNTRLETGHIVYAYEDLFDIVDIILVANMNYYQDIVNEVWKLNQKIVVFNMDLYLKTELPLEAFLEERRA